VTELKSGDKVTVSFTAKVRGVYPESITVDLGRTPEGAWFETDIPLEGYLPDSDLKVTKVEPDLLAEDGPEYLTWYTYKGNDIVQNFARRSGHPGNGVWEVVAYDWAGVIRSQRMETPALRILIGEKTIHVLQEVTQ